LQWQVTIFSNSTVFYGLESRFHTQTHIFNLNNEYWVQTTLNSLCKTMCLYVKPYDYKPQKSVNFEEVMYMAPYFFMLSHILF